MLSITISIVYAIIRVVYPYGTYLNPNHYSCVDDPQDDCADYGHGAGDE